MSGLQGGAEAKPLNNFMEKINGVIFYHMGDIFLLMRVNSCIKCVLFKIALQG